MKEKLVPIDIALLIIVHYWLIIIDVVIIY